MSDRRRQAAVVVVAPRLAMPPRAVRRSTRASSYNVLHNRMTFTPSTRLCLLRPSSGWGLDVGRGPTHREAAGLVEQGTDVGAVNCPCSTSFTSVWSDDGLRHRVDYLSGLADIASETARQLLSHFNWHHEAANYCCLKLRRSAPLQKLFGVWSCSCESEMHYASSSSNVEGATDEYLRDVVRIRDFDRTCWRLHNRHCSSPSLVRKTQEIS